MSAFIVPREHIAFLVEAATSPDLQGAAHPDAAFVWWIGGRPRELRCGDDERAVEVARMLWAENARSVRYRYEGVFDEPIYPVHRTPRFKVTPARVFKACDCFEYQSCEHPEWEESEARAFINALRRRAARAVPGYEEAPWVVDASACVEAPPVPLSRLPR